MRKQQQLSEEAEEYFSAKINVVALVDISKQNAFTFRLNMVTSSWNLLRDLFWVKSSKQQITRLQSSQEALECLWKLIQENSIS